MNACLFKPVYKVLYILYTGVGGTVTAVGVFLSPSMF